MASDESALHLRICCRRGQGKWHPFREGNLSAKTFLQGPVTAQGARNLRYRNPFLKLRTPRAHSAQNRFTLRSVNAPKTAPSCKLQATRKNRNTPRAKNLKYPSGCCAILCRFVISAGC